MRKSLDFSSRHSNVSEWYESFGPNAQIVLCNPQFALGAISSLEEDLCPTLGLFKTCYHTDAMNWMRAQIDVLNVSSSAQNKLNAQQITLLAADIFSQYYYWNLADLCVFFGKIRRGQWGVFYNNVDNISIMNWAREFDRERRHELYIYDQAIADQRKVEARTKGDTISSDDYLATLTDEQKEKSTVYALKCGKRKFFEDTPKERTIKTGIVKPADLDCPPPLSAETAARRDAMIEQLMKQDTL